MVDGKQCIPNLAFVPEPVAVRLIPSIQLELGKEGVAHPSPTKTVIREEGHFEKKKETLAVVCVCVLSKLKPSTSLCVVV